MTTSNQACSGALCSDDSSNNRPTYYSVGKIREFSEGVSFTHVSVTCFTNGAEDDFVNKYVLHKLPKTMDIPVYSLPSAAGHMESWHCRRCETAQLD